MGMEVRKDKYQRLVSASGKRYKKAMQSTLLQLFFRSCQKKISVQIMGIFDFSISENIANGRGCQGCEKEPATLVLLP